MHVLLLTEIDDPFDPPGLGRFGGGHYFIFDLARHLVRQGDEVTLVTRLNSISKPLLQRVAPRLVVHRLNIGPAVDLGGEDVGAFLPELEKAAFEILADRRFDAIHSQYWISGVVAAAWCKARGGCHVHAPLSLGRRKKAEGMSGSQYSAIRDGCELEIFRSASWIVVTSPDERQALKTLYPEVNSKHVALIPYGVDPDLFYPRPGSADHYLRRQARSAGEGP
jgi:D-inositol-3-phosphate glycosyltransferase